MSELRDEYWLSFPGVLKVVLRVDPQDLNPRTRPIVMKFQRAARGKNEAAQYRLLLGMFEELGSPLPREAYDYVTPQVAPTDPPEAA